MEVMRETLPAALMTLLIAAAGCAAHESESALEAPTDPRPALREGRLDAAAKTSREAAEGGDIGAQYTLGVLLALGLVPGGEPSEAIDWYRRVAEQGDADCKFKLGELYFTGAEPVEVSERVRASWVERLAGLGEPKTPLKVGSDFPMGSAGLPADAAEAFTWFSRAAEGDHVVAWRRLGEMRLKGVGSERSLAHAHMWFSLLAERDLGNAGIWLTLIRGEMTDAEVAESARLLEAFRSRGPTPR
jgi:uncharacterized protein